MFEKLNNLTSELNILKMNSSHSSQVPKHVSSPPRRKRCSSVPTSHDGEILTSLSFSIFIKTRVRTLIDYYSVISDHENIQLG